LRLTSPTFLMAASSSTWVIVKERRPCAEFRQGTGGRRVASANGWPPGRPTPAAGRRR
jgi:hypothetical protein